MVVDCWYEVFNLLNIKSIYCEDIIAAMPTLPSLLHFDDPPAWRSWKFPENKEDRWSVRYCVRADWFLLFCEVVYLHY